VGWLEVPKGSLGHLRTLTHAAGSMPARRGWAMEGNSSVSGAGAGFEARCGLRGGCMEVTWCFARVRALYGGKCYPRSE